ncbi:putative N-acetyltransferase YafP [Marinomonas aquimarina]|uniref:Putative N-acetyltransferase YafP n=1 Tax=Marinomonas aquimarina TaxID=295068 RepID=A0A1A8T848_9GAMM|nr:GNAT family N-acetyltransferase [Marinomonas aquimarina]SBS28806.1 putative N-acetyltransferase YafP [Marinomonas aquimarina]
MNPNTVIIEPFTSQTMNVRELLDVFHRSVHAVPDAIYSAEQKSAWAPDCVDAGAWNERLAQHQVWVARDEKNRECLGFIELDLSGDLECLYICPRAQRQGIAKRLVITAFENMSQQFPEKTNWQVQASDTAYEFFLKLGFLPTKRNQIERFGILLENTTMAKDIC